MGTGQGSGSVVEVVDTGGDVVVTLTDVDVPVGSVVVVVTLEVVVATVLEVLEVLDGEVVDVVDGAVEVGHDGAGGHAAHRMLGAAAAVEDGNGGAVHRAEATRAWCSAS